MISGYSGAVGPVIKKMEEQSKQHWRSNPAKWIHKSVTEPPMFSIEFFTGFSGFDHHSWLKARQTRVQTG